MAGRKMVAVSGGGRASARPSDTPPRARRTRLLFTLQHVADKPLVRSEDLDVVPVGLNVEPIELARLVRRVDGDHPLGIQRGVELVEQREERGRSEHALIEAHAAGTFIQFGEQLLALELTSLRWDEHTSDVQSP